MQVALGTVGEGLRPSWEGAAVARVGGGRAGRIPWLGGCTTITEFLFLEPPHLPWALLPPVFWGPELFHLEQVVSPRRFP